MKKTVMILSAIIGMCGVLQAATVALADDQYIAYKDIPAEVTYTGSTTVGDDFEFKLGEERDAGKVWQVVSYNPAICRIKIDHDRDGVWPFVKEKAEIEVKVLVRGAAKVVLQCGTKQVTLIVTAL